MKLTFNVTYNDKSAVDTTATTADFVAFEGAYSRSIMNLEADLRLTDVCWLAWRSLSRTGITGLDFNAWLDTVDEVQLIDGEATPAPLEPTANTSA
jgi:hypothetical protein